MLNFESDPAFWALVKTLTEAVQGQTQNVALAALSKVEDFIDEEAGTNPFTGRGAIFARRPRRTDAY